MNRTVSPTLGALGVQVKSATGRTTTMVGVTVSASMTGEVSPERSLSATSTCRKRPAGVAARGMPLAACLQADQLSWSGELRTRAVVSVPAGCEPTQEIVPHGVLAWPLSWMTVQVPKRVVTVRATIPVRSPAASWPVVATTSFWRSTMLVAGLTRSTTEEPDPATQTFPAPSTARPVGSVRSEMEPLSRPSATA